MVRSSLQMFLSVFVSLLLCSFTEAKEGKVSNDIEQPAPIPMEQLKAFAETYWQIKHLYVDQVDDRQLLEGAINGMLKSLDPYSGYLNKQDLLELQSSADGVYDGLGVEVIAEDNRVKVVSILEDSPAERAGIRANDIITMVNSKRVAEIGADKAIDSMRGKAGEGIKLQVLPQGKGHPVDLEMIRETLEMKSVRIRDLQDGFWLIELTMFQRDTGYELTRELHNKVSGKAVNGLILDLRDNPGGVLRAAVDVVDLVLPGGMIVSTEGRAEENAQRYYANPGDELEQVPLVVLINNRSASASEIVAGALQDHQRALIVGEKSYGKGVVQSILPIQQNAAIKLTTSRYFTPKGRTIHGSGIEPDILLKQPEQEADNDWVLDRALALLSEQVQSKL